MSNFESRKLASAVAWLRSPEGEASLRALNDVLTQGRDLDAAYRINQQVDQDAD